MLKFGSRGSEVEALQQFLIDQGYDLGDAGADGIFGSKTRTAVRQFQSDQGITIDGVVGPTTQGKIDTFGIPDEEPAGDEPVVDPETGEVIEDDIITPEGAVEGGDGTAGIPGVMAGGTIHRIANPDGQQDFYVISYEYPPGSGHSFFYRFDSIEALEQTVGPNLGGGAVAVGEMLNESVLGAWTDAGHSSEIAGVEGSFEGYMNDLMVDVAAQAGGVDPSLVGQALQDPDILLILAQTAEGNWTPLQTKAALRNTDYYKDVLYPGIENFYAQSDNPEALYAMYKQNVTQVAKSLGLQADANGGYGSTVAALLDAGVTDTAFANFSTTYKQAQANVGFAGALSKWTERYTGTAIESFEDYFDVLAGNAPAEVQEIAEAAGIQYMAENAGFEISDAQIQALGEQIDLSQEEAGALFSRTARDLLSLGESGLRRGNLTSQQVLDAEAGIGGNVEEVKLRMSKLAREEGLSDDPTAAIFTDFNREGAPIKKGLQSTISEGA
jgi:N-acetylmuramoyl-L-alanine amidase/peptidoglycan L-alanyl-D-glutamate endopeptidase CwlK